MKVELQLQKNVKIFLDDGTVLACEAGTIFTFVTDGELCSPSTSAGKSYFSMVNNTAGEVRQQSVFSTKGILSNILYILILFYMQLYVKLSGYLYMHIYIK